MNYCIHLKKQARKFISLQPKTQQEKLLKAINKLPIQGDIKPLAGHEGKFRLRVGDYRVIYIIEDEILLITVVNVGNRGQIYKNLRK